MTVCYARVICLSMQNWFGSIPSQWSTMPCREAYHIYT